MAKVKQTIDFSDLLGEPEGTTIANAGDEYSSYELEQVSAPKAVVLFWSRFACKCGNTFTGPTYHSGALLKHDHLRHVCFGHYKKTGDIYTPLHGTMPDLPIEYHWQDEALSCCPMCVAARPEHPEYVRDPGIAFDLQHQCARRTPEDIGAREILMYNSSLEQVREWTEQLKSNTLTDAERRKIEINIDRADRRISVHSLKDLKARYVAAQQAAKWGDE